MLTGLANLDASTCLWLNRVQQKTLLTRLNRWISHSGDGHCYALIAVLIYLSAPVGYLNFLKVGLLAFVIELPCFIILKSAIKRDRPFLRLHACATSIEPGDKFSMPSGHTAAAFLMAGVIAAFFMEFAIPAYCWACLIGNSRIALGVHYPSDVLAGAVLGSAATLLALNFIL